MGNYQELNIKYLVNHVHVCITKPFNCVAIDNVKQVISHRHIIYVFPDGDDTMVSQQEHALEKAKKRALSSSIMRDLKAQYSEAPEEVRVRFTHR